MEAVIDQDGNGVIPADQLPARLPEGTRLRLHLDPVGARRRPVESVLPDLPYVSWEQFEAASRLAVRDAEDDRGLS